MNRCLHITINERPGALPRRATTYLPGRSGADPEHPYVMPDPDDPEHPYVMPDPDDPEHPYVMPDPDDPSHPYFLSGGTGGWGTTIAASHACCCVPVCQDKAEPGKASAPNPFVSPRDYSGFVIVRTAEGVVSHESLAENLWALAKEHKPKLTGLTAVLELAIDKAEKSSDPLAASAAPGMRGSPGSGGAGELSEPPTGVLVSRPLVELQGRCGPLSRSECLAVLRALEKKTATTAFPPLHSLTAYWRLDLREHPDLVEEGVARLNRLAEVDLAYRELAANDPHTTGTTNGTLLAEDQGYLDDAPTGISAAWAWKSLAGMKSPATVTLCDLEQGWTTDHMDLKPLVLPDIIYGANRAPNEGSSGHHGTAVLGQLAAAGQSPFGVKGAAADLGRFVLASHYRAKDENYAFPGTNGHVAAAIAQALSQPVPAPLVPLVPLKAGDILLLEVQRALLPTEVDEADFDTIRLASGLGIIVVEAAGNGGFNLDAYTDPGTGRSLRRGDPRFRDSGAILVGAARASLPHDRAPFSNYGSRLDCFGWGETVTTCGYGDLAGTGATDFYTNTFSGTSSASPIIAGAAALLQSLHHAYTGERLEPQAMRTLLSDPATGTRQGPNVPGHIGVMPDLKAIVRGRLQLVPDVYIRRSIGDAGSQPGLTDEISSSPDLLVWPKKLNKTRARYGEGSRRENTPAPGAAIEAGQPNNLYVRLRNCGLGLGDVHVQLFASPAATLITSERWIPIGGLTVSQSIPQGDTLFVAGPIVWQPPSPPLAPPWSFLAVLTQPGEGPAPLGPPYFDWAAGLPPGPPYFDWAEYRAFLRRPGVAWRNTHRVSATSPAPLSFCIASTPERAHVFDFEVIQRLPAGATVTLQVPNALAAKLRQRQPWLKGGSGPLSLPQRPRTAICGVQLAAGACADATFTVTAGGPPLTTGHSLAVRQLWRGEEVGRITWIFGLDQ
ncbi:MAG TPA: S8 family serine peptidase [Thermoanaerobaculia bacterium]